MQLELTTINKILKESLNISLSYDLKDFYGLPNTWKKVSKTTDEYYGKEDQGSEGECVCVFQIEYLPKVFIQIIFYTDSYGEHQGKKTIQFVTDKEKTITVYEPI